MDKYIRTFIRENVDNWIYSDIHSWLIGSNKYIRIFFRLRKVTFATHCHGWSKFECFFFQYKGTSYVILMQNYCVKMVKTSVWEMVGKRREEKLAWEDKWARQRTKRLLGVGYAWSGRSSLPTAWTAFLTEYREHRSHECYMLQNWLKTQLICCVLHALENIW